MKNDIKTKVIVHVVFAILTLCFLIPILMIFIVSITSESAFTSDGFSFVPKAFSLDAYKYLLSNFGLMGRSIVLTLVLSILRPLCAIALCATLAYPLSRDDFKYKGPVYVLVIGSMFLNGGLMPTYMVYTGIYGLKDNLAVYLLSHIVTAWNVIIFRTFFRGIPKALHEAAEIDGANKAQVLLRVVVPMSKPILGIQFFNQAIAMWNDYQTSLVYMSSSENYTVQHLMQRLLQETKFLVQQLQQSGVRDVSAYPIETMKYAMCVFAVLPILLLFPYIQKYFAKGIAVGAVKE